MYSAAPGKSSSATRPPCFWNWGTAAGAVLKTRHGAFPAVIAAPMTSSEVLPAGISWAVTSSVGWAVFHASTMALPQATSSGLLDSQTLTGPCAACAPEASEPPEPPELPQAAHGPVARVSTAAAATLLLFIATSFRCGSARVRDGPWVRRCPDGMAARWKLEQRARVKT